MIEIRWHGRGGQGAKTVSQLWAAALLEAGKWVQAFPEYGPERSGAPVQAYNRSDDSAIRRRAAVTSPDVVVVLDPSLLVEVDVTAGLDPGGLLLVNTEESAAAVRERVGFEGRIVCVSGDRLATGAGATKANVVVAGALAKALGDPPVATLKEGARIALGGKFSPAALATTVAAIEAGYGAVGEGRCAPVSRTPRADRPTRGLKRYRDLAVGAVVAADTAGRTRTGGWRTGQRPEVELRRCINCLLCWVYCPDSAVELSDEVVFVGFDYDLCKGCALCVEACPTGAIAMVDESPALRPGLAPKGK